MKIWTEIDCQVFPHAQQKYDSPEYFNFYGDSPYEGADVGEASESMFPSGFGADGLPRDIYCDLANTLPSKCAGRVQSNVVSIHQV